MQDYEETAAEIKECFIPHEKLFYFKFLKCVNHHYESAASGNTIVIDI